jgi:hypothetical protein
MKQLREEYPNVAQMAQQWFQNQYGFDPRTELYAVTMFSRDYEPQNATVIVRADYNAEKVRGMLERGESLETTTWRDYKLQTVTLAKRPGEAQHEKSAQSDEKRDDGVHKKRMTVVLVDEETIVLGSSKQNAKAALKLLSGEGKSLQDQDSPLLAPVPEGALVHGAAVDLDQISRYEAILPALQQHDRVVYAFGTRDDGLFETLLLEGKSEQVAKQMQEVFEGLFAYEQLWAAENETLKNLIEDAEISRDGNRLTVNWEGDTEQVLSTLDALKKRGKQWMAAFSEGH